MKRAYRIALALAAGLVALVLVFWITRPGEESVRRSAAVVEMAENWSGDLQFETSYDALDPAAFSAGSAQDEGATVASAAAGNAFDPADDYGGLPRNLGYEEVAGYCAACHSLQIVMQQRRSERRWNELVTWMIDQQGMAEPPAADRKRIVDYLARNYGEDAR